MTGLTPGYEPETGQVILEGRPAGVAGEARLVPVSGAELAFDRAGGHLSRVVVDTGGTGGPGERVAALLVRLFGRDGPGAVRGAAAGLARQVPLPEPAYLAEVLGW